MPKVNQQPARDHTSRCSPTPQLPAELWQAGFRLLRVAATNNPEFSTFLTQLGDAHGRHVPPSSANKRAAAKAAALAAASPPPNIPFVALESFLGRLAAVAVRNGGLLKGQAAEAEQLQQHVAQQLQLLERQLGMDPM